MYCKYCGNKLSEGAKFCSKCGKPVNEKTEAQFQNPKGEKQGAQDNLHEKAAKPQQSFDQGFKVHAAISAAEQPNNKTTESVRLAMGVLSIVLFIVIFIQSCAAGVVNSMNHSKDVGGSAGLIVGILAMAAGIVGIVNRRNGKGSIIAGAIYILGGLLGVGNSDVYQDLSIWGTLFFAFGVYFIYTGKKQLN